MADPSGWASTGPPDPPRRRPLLPIVLAAVLVVALAGGTVWATLRRAQPEPPTVAPSAPASEPAESPTTPATEPTAPDEGRPIRLAELVQQVAEVRQLARQERVRSRQVSQEALAEKVSDIAFSELDREQVAADERLLVALRLAPPAFDLAASVEQLYREQILGLYVPKEKTLYVRGTGDATPAERITTAHEITHALQDQHFDLVNLQESVEDDTDAGLAVLSLIEGDAVLTQQLWALRHLSSAEQQQAIAESAGGGQALADAPDYLRASLFFPYEQGSRFVAALYREGGPAAVDAAFERPPTTSEQILHPERYLDDEGAMEVAAAPRPGSAWRRPFTYQFGEFDLRELLRPLGDTTAEEAAAGWGGGEVRTWSSGDAIAVSAAMAFDSGADADEACTAVRSWFAEVADAAQTGDDTYTGDRDDHLVIRCAGDEVRFGLAPDPETARRAAVSP